MSNGQIPKRELSHLPAHYGNHRDKKAEFSRVSLMVLSSLSLAIALAGIMKLVYDVFSLGYATVRFLLPVQLVIVAIAYIIGWVLALLDTRKYSNLVMPIIIELFTWAVMVATSILYGLIIQRLYLQNYTVEKYIIFWILLFLGYGISISLQLIPEGGKISRFSIPIFTVSLVHLISMVIHYVFFGEIALDFVAADLFVFFGMLGIGVLFLTNMPFLKPIRDMFDQLYSREKARIQLIEDRR